MATMVEKATMLRYTYIAYDIIFYFGRIHPVVFCNIIAIYSVNKHDIYW